MISRRGLLAGSAAFAAFGGAARASPGALADAAAANGLLFGASIGDEAFNDPAYADLYRRETRIVTTDVALKFDWLRPSRDRFEFWRADRIVEQAQKAGKPV